MGISVDVTRVLARRLVRFTRRHLFLVATDDGRRDTLYRTLERRLGRFVVVKRGRDGRGGERAPNARKDAAVVQGDDEREEDASDARFLDPDATTRTPARELETEMGKLEERHRFLSSLNCYD